MERRNPERTALTVSVIIPTYNRRKDVFGAIESVFAQSLPVLEVIVVDDGSTDGTADLVEQHYGQRVRLIRQANAGVSAARNMGIRQSRGEWLAFLDSDDRWSPEKLELQFAAIQKFGDAASVCFTNNIYTGNPAMTFSRFEEVGFQNPPKVGILYDMIWKIIAEREPFFTSSLLIRKTILDEVGCFDEGLTIREDTDLVFRLAAKTNFCFVREAVTQIDRTPTRSIGLCNLYDSRSDVVFQCSERIYIKWLEMPEVRCTQYEPRIRELLLRAYYDSIESMIHQIRFKPALRNLQRLRARGQGCIRILITLVIRKIQKINRNRQSRRKLISNQPGASQAALS